MRVSSPPSPAVVERFRYLILMMIRALGARASAPTGMAFAHLPILKPPLLPAPLVGLVYARLRRLEREFLALVARIRAGTPRARTPSPGGKAPVDAAGGDEARPVRAGTAPVKNRFPMAWGWLLRLCDHHMAWCHTELRKMLAEPEMRALLEASPRVGRLLGPLCRMLAMQVELLDTDPETTRLSMMMAVPPKRPRATRPSRAAGTSRPPLYRKKITWEERRAYGECKHPRTGGTVFKRIEGS